MQCSVELCRGTKKPCSITTMLCPHMMGPIIRANCFIVTVLDHCSIVTVLTTIFTVSCEKWPKVSLFPDLARFSTAVITAQ
jgi:hypothetical protein